MLKGYWGLFAGVGVSIVLHPALFWHFYVQISGQPSLNGMPADYWRSELKRYVLIVRYLEPKERRRSNVTYQFGYTGTPLALPKRILNWVSEKTGRGFYSCETNVADLSFQPDAVPVLVFLADDKDPAVRAFAYIDLGALAQRFPATKPAIMPTLRRALKDKGRLPGDDPPVTIDQLIADHFPSLCTF